jgi:hypothetical protein
MVDEEAGADLRARMDFNACEESADVRDEPAGRAQAMSPQPVRGAMEVQGVKARIAQQDLDDAPGRRVSIESRPDIPSDGVEHTRLAY